MKRTFRQWFSGVFGLGFFLICALGAARAENLLILPFESADKRPELESEAQGVSDLLGAFLGPYSETIAVVDREHLQAILEEQSLSLSGLRTASIAKIAAIVPARHLLRGTFRRTGSEISVNALLFNLETTEMLKAFEIKGKKNEILGVAERLARELAGYYRTPFQKLPDLKPEQIDRASERNREFIFGLGCFYHRAYAQAIGHFMKILDDNPDDHEARYFLARSFREAGMKGHADLEIAELTRRAPRFSKLSEFKVKP